MNLRYQRYHPRWHRRRIPIFWWLAKLSYAKFISRELTSVCVGYAAIVLLLQVTAAVRGEAAYSAFQGRLDSGPVIVFHVLVLAVLLFHTVTWLNLAPKALVLHLGGRRLPDGLVLAAHYAAWLGASALVVWLLLGR